MKAAAVLVIALLAAGAALGAARLAGVGAGPAGSLPPVLGSLPRVELVTGSAALAEVARMHRGAVPLNAASVARYRRGDLEATVWASESRSPQEAAALLGTMIARLREVESGFEPPQPLRIAGQTVYLTRGGGQVHYIYQRGVRVVWLAATPETGPDALHSLLQR